MLRCISDILIKIASDLQEDKSSVYTIDNPVTSLKVKPCKDVTEGTEDTEDSKESEKGLKKPLIDVEERDIRKAKRPVVKPTRRQESFKTKWKGEGSREVRKDYQKQYRIDNGNV